MSGREALNLFLELAQVSEKAYHEVNRTVIDGLGPGLQVLPPNQDSRWFDPRRLRSDL